MADNCQGESEEAVEEVEIFVASLLGETFQYELGKILPEFDLMVWSVLMNNRDLAFVWFKEYMYPIRCVTARRFPRLEQDVVHLARSRVCLSSAHQMTSLPEQILADGLWTLPESERAPVHPVL